MKTEREFDPGQALVYPLPNRQPWETFARWGMPPERPGQYERPWYHPGPPPSLDLAPMVRVRVTSGPQERRDRTPRWAVACVLVGSALLVVAAVLTVVRG
jgi:hypothetical protein